MSDLLTIEEVAAILNVSPDTVTRRFAKVKGVIDIGSPETPRRRRYRVLRIPKSVVEKYLLARGGPAGEIKSPARPEKAPKKKLNVPPSEDEIVRQLATIPLSRGIGFKGISWQTAPQRFTSASSKMAKARSASPSTCPSAASNPNTQ